MLHILAFRYIFDILGALAGALVAFQMWREKDMFHTEGSLCCPMASVIVPAKGRDVQFRKNVESLMKQDYPNYELIYVVDEEDEAYRELRSMGITPVLTWYKCSGCSGKVRALLSGIASSKGDVLVFADSDTEYPPNWLRSLIRPLDRYMASTLFSWPKPVRLSFRNLMRAGFWTLGFESQFTGGRFLWGGSMAFRRELFDQRTMEELSREWCDDCTMTRIVKSRNGAIAFVGEATPANVYDEENLLRWSSRQVITIWLHSSRGARAFIVIGWFFLILLAGSLVTGAWLGATPFILWWFKNWARSRRLGTWAVWGILMSVPAIFYGLFLLILNRKRREVEWRGVKYTLPTGRKP